MTNNVKQALPQDGAKMPRRQSKKDLANALLKKLDEWQKNGDTVEEALEKLTMKQYDFLIDYGINLDDLILTNEQQKAVKAITKTPRKLKEGGYNKKYPKTKIELYTQLKDFITSLNGQIIPREKENYRDLDFTIENIAYKIVLSNPRTKKE